MAQLIITHSLVWASYSSIFLFMSSISAWQKEQQLKVSAFVLTTYILSFNKLDYLNIYVPS